MITHHFEQVGQIAPLMLFKSMLLGDKQSLMLWFVLEQLATFCLKFKLLSSYFLFSELLYAISHSQSIDTIVITCSPMPMV